MFVLNGTSFLLLFQMTCFLLLIEGFNSNKAKRPIALTGNILLIFPWFLENLAELKKKKL